MEHSRLLGSCTNQPGADLCEQLAGCRNIPGGRTLRDQLFNVLDNYRFFGAAADYVEVICGAAEE